MADVAFNPHAIPVFLSAAAALILGVVSKTRRRNYPPSTHFLVLCLGIFVWLFCTGMGLISTHPDQALWWFRIDNAGVMFISPSFFAFSASLADAKARKWRIRVGYALALAYAACSLYGGFPATGVKRFSWGYFPQWSAIRSIPFFTLFFGYMTGAFLVLRGALHGELNSRIRTQVRYVLIAFIIAYFGSVDYLATFGVNVYPFGYIPIMALVAVIFYAIVQHRLMNLDLVLRDTTVYALSAGIVGVLAFVSGFPFAGWSVYGALFVGVASAILLMAFAYQPLRRLLQPTVDRIVFSNRFGYLEELAQLPNDLLEFTNLREMLRFLTTRLTDAGRLSEAHVLMYDPAHQSYVETMSSQDAAAESERGFELSQGSALIALLSEESRLWTIEEFSGDASGAAFSELQTLRGAACFPVKRGDELIGLVVLGKKMSNEPFNQRDLRVLRALRVRLENFLGQAMSITQEALNMVKDSHDMKNDVNALKGRITWRAMRAAGWWNEFDKRLTLLRQTAESVDAPHRATVVEQLSLLRREAEVWYEDLKKSGPVEDNTLRRLAHRLKNWGEYGRLVSEGFKGQRAQEELDVRAAVLMSVERWRPVAEKKKVALMAVCEEAPLVWGERSLLEQVVENLIDNALKATVSGSVEVRVREANQKVYIDVADTGCGIPEADVANIFNRPFYQGKGRESLEQSTGIGLYLVAQYVRSLGGTVKAESQLGQGSVFHVELPVYASSAAPKGTTV